MSKLIACITDPHSHPEFDTTVELYRRLVEDRRFELIHVDPSDVSNVWGTSSREIKYVPVRTAPTFAEFLALSEAEKQVIDLEQIDFLFHRTDKPFPDKFLEQLSQWEGLVCMANSPGGLLRVDCREFVSKHMGKYLPVHLFTGQAEEAIKFIKDHQDIVAKKNSSYGGKGVSRIRHAELGWDLIRSDGETSAFQTLEELLIALPLSGQEPHEFVRFLKNVGVGDKRILVIDGEIVGAYLRRSVTKGWINNVTQGGECLACDITEKEKDCVFNTVPNFSKHGVYTLGYDFLMNDDGSWVLSEINAGNIGGYNRLQPIYGIDGFEYLFNWIQSRIYNWSNKK